MEINHHIVLDLILTKNFVTADEDTSLNDNASGYTNFAAPGADRLSNVCQFTKKRFKRF